MTRVTKINTEGGIKDISLNLKKFKRRVNIEICADEVFTVVAFVKIS